MTAMSKRSQDIMQMHWLVILRIANPRIQEVFNQWKNTDALISNLRKK